VPRPGEHFATYDHAGNMSIGFDASSYVHDAQNRLTQATTNGVTITFKYDGLNRQVRRTVTDQPDTFSVWDGWDLIQEYQAANNGAATAAYLYGATGLIADSHMENSGFNYYYQDASGSTSHLANGSGQLLEWYRYDLHGAPFFYDASDNQLSASSYSVRHLFTGQQWYQDLGLYDLRNRFYSPDIGRFLQPDPIGFRGDRTNLYRYCRNNPVTRWDPFGLQSWGSGQKIDLTGPGGEAEAEHQYVTGDPVPDPVAGDISDTGFLAGDFGFGGFPTMGSDNPAFHQPRNYIPFARPPENHQPSVQHPGPSSVPEQNPATTTTITSQTISVSFDSTHQFERTFGGMGGANYYYDFRSIQGFSSDWTWNGVTITENSGLIGGVMQRLTVSPRGVSYRIAVGFGLSTPPGSFSVTSGAQLGQSPTGLSWTVQSSVSGGNGIVGGTAGSTWFSSDSPLVTAGAGWGVGLGGTITWGPTLYIPWHN
jgi:RHS repeat-associated protein